MACVKTFKFFGQSWECDKGIQNDLISRCEPSDKIFKIIIEKDTRVYNCFSIVKEDKILDMIQENKAIHEIIFSYPRRVYFDIDIKNDETTIFNLIQAIKVYISNDEANVYGYETEGKKSYHITLSNTYFENDEDRLKFKDYLIFLKTLYPNEFGKMGHSDDIVDTKVYSIRQAFKCYNQSKVGGEVQTALKYFKIRDLKNCFVSCFIGEIKKKYFFISYNF